jgi:hypothetical protein
MSDAERLEKMLQRVDCKSPALPSHWYPASFKSLEKVFLQALRLYEVLPIRKLAAG